MRFVIIDLIPALLQWEGRDSYDLATARPLARDLVASLFSDFRLAAITDGDHPASDVHEALERLDLAAYFESVGTSSVFGPKVTPRVVRRITRAIGGAGHTIVVTARPSLADGLRRSGIATVLAGDDLMEAATAVRRIAHGRISP